MQSPRKRQEGASHPDRNAQFEHINAAADSFLAKGQPVISVDTKKKELVGNFKNGGREWQPKGTPPAVLVHDFPSDAEGKAIPYGVYDMARNEAWVSVGRDHDTPAFAVASIRHWVWLFFVGHPEGFGERHGKSYLTRRRRGEEGGGGGSVTGGTVPSV